MQIRTDCAKQVSFEVELKRKTAQNERLLSKRWKEIVVLRVNNFSIFFRIAQNFSPRFILTVTDCYPRLFLKFSVFLQ